MKNEPHVIGDRVPNEHDLIVELKLAPRGASDRQADAAARTGVQPRFPLLRAILGFAVRALRERHNRLALLELNDEQLKDIGVSRCQAYGDGYSRYRRGVTNADEAGAEPR